MRSAGEAHGPSHAKASSNAGAKGARPSRDLQAQGVSQPKLGVGSTASGSRLDCRAAIAT